MPIVRMLLMLSAVALATGVFVAQAKPDVVISFAIRFLGLGEDWFQEHLANEELSRLRRVARLGSWVGLVAVFGWSFFVGVVLQLSRVS
jgi:hypothetical protein